MHIMCASGLCIGEDGDDGHDCLAASAPLLATGNMLAKACGMNGLANEFSFVARFDEVRLAVHAVVDICALRVNACVFA